jgi:hypothetical protein
MSKRSPDEEKTLTVALTSLDPSAADPGEWFGTLSR